MNTCALVGIVERAPTVIDSEGPLQARFTLRVEEIGKDGKAYPLYIPCECYGQLATRSATWDAGAMLALSGRLKWRKGDEKTQKPGGLAVFVKEVHVLEPASVAAE